MAYKYSKDDLEKALETLHSGGILLYPTDTVWGLGCDATNEVAVQRIFELKKRETDMPLLLLIDAPGRIPSYVEEMPDLAWDLIEMSEKPLSIIYDKARNLAPSVIARDGSVGIRVCEEPFVKTLLQRFRRPMVSTSANISGTPTPLLFSQIETEVKQTVDYVVRYRQEDMQTKASSSIIKLQNDGQITVIRE